jgi:hypothetical protein
MAWFLWQFGILNRECYWDLLVLKGRHLLELILTFRAVHESDDRWSLPVTIGIRSISLFRPSFKWSAEHMCHLALLTRAHAMLAATYIYIRADFFHEFRRIFLLSIILKKIYQLQLKPRCSLSCLFLPFCKYPSFAFPVHLPLQLKYTVQYYSYTLLLLRTWLHLRLFNFVSSFEVL